MKLRYFIPIAAFLITAVALAIGLTLNPGLIPSALIDEPVPEFELESVYPDKEGFNTADLARGEPVLVNIFASWCPPCRVEHPLLMDLANNKGVQIYGLAYKDTPADTRAFLDELGNPYTAIGDDQSGRVGIDWGVYGVPETFIVTGEGRIALKHIGPLNERAIEETILPTLERLKDKDSAGS